MPRIKNDKNSFNINSPYIFSGNHFQINKYSHTIEINIDSHRLNLIACCICSILWNKKKTNSAANKLYISLTKRKTKQNALIILASKFYYEFYLQLNDKTHSFLQNLQNLFNHQYRIVIFDNLIGSNVFFKGSYTTNIETIYLLRKQSNDKSYAVILNPKLYFKLKYFCPDCLMQCRQSRKFQNICCKVCLKCLTPNCIKFNNEHKYCDKCNRYFYGSICFNNHLQNDTCKNLIRCSDCGNQINKNSKEKHECLVNCCKQCHGNHKQGHCFIVKQERKVRAPLTCVYFDLETFQNSSRELRPYLCVASWKAPNKVIKTKHFVGYDCVRLFILWLFSTFTKEIIVCAHNFKAFDGIFVQKELNAFSNIKYDVIYDGTKLNMIAIKKGLKTYIKFIDSFNFLGVSLRQMPKIFGFKDCKTFFPYKMLNDDYLNYEGVLPSIDNYETFLLKAGEIADFNAFYANQQNIYKDDKKWNMMDVLTEYCVNDVIVLLNCMEEFRKIHIEITNNDLFLDLTLAGSCIRDFIDNHMEPQSIGIIPAKGYSRCSNQSDSALMWLKFTEKQSNCRIEHAQQGGEFKFKGRNYKLDGVCHATKTAYEFMGCYWHGCNKCFSNVDYNPSRNSAMPSLYSNTMDRLREIKHLMESELPDYSLKVIWEHDFVNEVCKSDEYKQFLQSLQINPEINKNIEDREFYYGG
jgi:G:T-mismatch repair DNA endonuclease (very short patch repair protein)